MHSKVSHGRKILKGEQANLERRLYKGSPEGSEMNDLEGLPGVKEECYDAFTGNVPTRRKHLITRAGIIDNCWPEEIIELRNPDKMEPKVTMAQKKLIFPVEKDADVASIRAEPVRAT